VLIDAWKCISRPTTRSGPEPKANPSRRERARNYDRAESSSIPRETIRRNSVSTDGPTSPCRRTVIVAPTYRRRAAPRL